MCLKCTLSQRIPHRLSCKRLYVITPSGEQINYICVDACDGHNDVTGFDALQKNDGTVVWGSADLIVYTCLSDAYNVRIVCFNRA